MKKYKMFRVPALRTLVRFAIALAAVFTVAMGRLMTWGGVDQAVLGFGLLALLGLVVLVLVSYLSWRDDRLLTLPRRKINR